MSGMLSYLIGIFNVLLAVAGTGAAIYFWIKKKTVPAIIFTIIGAFGLFVIACSTILLLAID